MYDLIILGGGPAATAAGVYAARKQLTTLVITKEFGGQSIVSPDIQNWIGAISISGESLAKSLKEHLEHYKGEYLTIHEDTAEKLDGSAGNFTVTTSDGTTHMGKTVLVATGAGRRKLAVPGAQEFDQKGLTYCASCDGPVFSGMDVAVIGGGNAGFESAAQLLAYAKSVTLLEYSENYKADAITVEKVLAHPNMKGLPNVEVLEVLGEQMVTGLRYKNRTDGNEHTLPIQGVFVEIGVIPNTAFLEGIVELNQHKHITTDPRTQRTSLEGVWAAGDCTDALYQQNNIAVGDGVKALEDIYIYLHTH